MALALVYFATIIISVATRIKVFSYDFMDQFNEEHCKHFPDATRAPEYGFPDLGCGRFAAKLSYSQWLDMNNA